MKRVIITLLISVSLASLSAQIEKIKKKNQPVCEQTVLKKSKKGTNYTTLYTVENYYSKFEDGIYAEFNTDSGRIICKLHYDKVPLTVCNFVGLAEGTIPNDFRGYGKPFYDSLKFHRVISNFMIQGGDPVGNGTGGPGYSFADEFSPDLTHEGPGILSMANSGPNTNGSQFFITHVATPWLNNKHSIFGKVVEGMDIVNKVQTNNTIKSLRIIRKGNAAIDFKADSAAFAHFKTNIGKTRDSLTAINAKTQNFATNDEEVLKRFPTAKKTASGLWYVAKKEGTGKKANSGNIVKVHYAGRLPNGSEFDNSILRGEPFSFNLGTHQVIAGWDEGIALMHEGSEYTLIIPASLAYGSHGAGDAIPPNSTIIFETQLISVTEKDEASDFATNADLVLKRYPTAKPTPSGLWYVVESPGTGEQAVAGKTVKVHYAGALADGTEFDNSYKRGQPIEFKLGVHQVIDGWDEGIALMKVGAKYKLIIPSALGYGSAGAGGVIPPNATLVFETELIEVK